MASHKAAWTLQVLESIADGEWHRFDEVVHSAMAFVPSGKAARRALLNRETTRRAYLERRGQTETRPIRRADANDEEKLVRSGRRIIVVQAIINAGRLNTIETKGTGVDRMIRLRPLAKVIDFDRAAQKEAS